jgi:hypothetical protein
LFTDGGGQEQAVEDMPDIETCFVHALTACSA